MLNAGVTMMSGTYIACSARMARSCCASSQYASACSRGGARHVGHDIGARLVAVRRANQADVGQPGKTREGLLGGMLPRSSGRGDRRHVQMRPWRVPADRDGLWNGGMPQAAWLGLCHCGDGPLGDLVESLIKRDLGVKDMGNILKARWRARPVRRAAVTLPARNTWPVRHLVTRTSDVAKRPVALSSMTDHDTRRARIDGSIGTQTPTSFGPPASFRDRRARRVDAVNELADRLTSSGRGSSRWPTVPAPRS